MYLIQAPGCGAGVWPRAASVLWQHYGVWQADVCGHCSVQTWYPAASVDARETSSGGAGREGSHLLCLSYVHVPGCVHHRRSLHGIHRSHHLSGIVELHIYK